MGEQNDVKKPLLPPTLPRWWRVLPSLTLIMIISVTDSLVLNDFIEYRYKTYYKLNSSSTDNIRELCLNASQTFHTSTDSISTTTSKYPISTTMSWDDVIQASTARLNIYISLAATVPSIITSILLGANCDRIGRKPLIALPYLGKIIRYCILTAVAYYNLSNTYIILSVMLDGAFGTGTLSILSSFAYATDCTNEKTRTLAITIVDACIIVCKILPLLTVGIYLQNPNFIQSMIFTLSLSIAGFAFSIVLQPESNLNVQHLNIFQQLKLINFKIVTKMFQVFFVKRPEHKQRSLLLLVTIHLSMIVMLSGSFAMYYIYLYGAPFCFDSWGVSLVSVAQTVTITLLLIPYTLFVVKRTDHLVIPIIGILASIVQLILFGMAHQTWMIYLATCIGALQTVLTPVIRSRITKLVESNEYAVVFILASVFESGGYYAISAGANEIYRVTLTFYQGIVYFVFAIVGVITILLLFILHVLERRSPVMKRTLSINE